MSSKDYLNSFLRSVANKHREVEVIVSDDGSSDITLPKQHKTQNSTLIGRKDKQYYAESLKIAEALRKVKVSRHILERINALVVLHHSLETSLVEGTQAASFLNEILEPQGVKPTELDTYELLEQLEHGDFFPLLDAETGAITFTSSYEHAASTLQVDCDAWH
ncbi:MAG: hypothetical protein SGBAC_013298 [Bacillariaceae sp.]